jgi:hypothetical protein
MMTPDYTSGQSPILLPIKAVSLNPPPSGTRRKSMGCVKVIALRLRLEIMPQGPEGPCGYRNFMVFQVAVFPFAAFAAVGALGPAPQAYLTSQAVLAQQVYP